MSAIDPPPPSDDLAALVQRRRSRLAATERPAADAGTWGLALSGGGIRSATFCFGLLKALAHNKVLHRFDLLSTVSGGGYIGATVGKLFHNAATTGQPAKDVEEALADADTRWFAFWLRANGRYLIPRGGKDLLFAAANFSRNLVGVHMELALLCLLAGCLLVGLDLAVWQWADCVLSGNGCWQPAWVTRATLDALSDWPTLWMLLPPLLLAAASLAAAYWALPAAAGSRLPLQRWVMAVLCALGCWLLVRHWQQQQQPGDRSDALQVPGWLLIVAGGMLCAWVIGTVIAQFLTLRHAAAPDQSRHRLTGALARVLNAILIVAALGLVDVMAWLLANAKGDHQGAIGTVVLLTVVALRAVLPKIADLPRSLTPGTRRNLDGLINVAGVVMLAALLVFWVSVVHRSATFVLFDETRRVLQFALGWNWLAVIAVPVLLMIGISFRNRDFLNRSSLYAFYRARLVRSYLGATNVQRFRGLQKAATETYSRHVAAGGPSVSVQDVHAGDDVPLADYAPHDGGGPVHLINACVNQTRDPRGGLFNQDRKGLLMTVAPQGRVRVGQGRWGRMQGPDSLSLGSWVAISGAAVAPGLGSSTKSGIAALLTLSGVRLGYWWNALALQRDPGETAPRRVGKYAQLLGELRGRFDGLRRADWYLTDGGHFENTGAYALLREECCLIVVADCGADPRYAFGDLENLVRKARIDLQADIVFLKPRLAQPAPAADKPAADTGNNGDSGDTAPPPAESAPSVFGSLNDLVSTDSQACLALASIHYRSGKTGHLVVVKPNMCAGAPVDLVNYKADHPLFPQEPTTDQFFSETQWESYFQLGHTLGLNLQ
ncbi:MAG TPA: patatin-like phospholipase family protein, partial [Roseateles sp.]